MKLRLQDVPYLLAVAILALGIAMSVSVFSLVQAVLLRPLPFPRQNSLQVVWKKDATTGVPVVELAYPELGDLQSGVKAFESVALMPTTLYGYGKVIQAGGREPVQLESAPVSHDFFHVLGVAPLLGRDFTSADEQIGAAPTVILAYRAWQEQFHSDRAMVGQTIRMNGAGAKVIGVMGPGVEFPRGAGLWTPLGVTPMRENRSATYLQAIARVRPGNAQAQIDAFVAAIFERQARDFPGIYPSSQRAVVTPLPEYWTGAARGQLWIALGASLLLLLTACISAGNLLLSRAFLRRHEIATRLALGASSRQLLTHLAREAAGAALAACALGLALASGIIRLLATWAPADIPRLADAALDLPSFAFAAALALLAALVCAVAPAWLAMRIQPLTLLNQGGARSSGTRSSRRMQGAFVFAQAALTVTLLFTSLTLLLSYRAILRTDVGFANRDAVTMNLAVRGPGMEAPQRKAFYGRLLDQLRQAPGVISAGGALLRPLEGTVGWDLHYEFEAEAGQRDARALQAANFEAISPGYLATVGTPLLEGRDIDSHDVADSQPVVIVSRSLAQRLRKLGREPLGQRLRFRGVANWWTIAGVAADARYRGVTQPGDDMYISYLQTGIPTNYVAIRGTRSSAELVALVRKTAAGIDPSQAIAGVATLGDLISRDAAQRRFQLLLLLAFGASALVLAAAGVYSTVAESLASRTRETAVKLALGAGVARLVRDLVASTLKWVLLGEAVGLACALLVGRALAELLYAVSATDPRLLAAVFAFLFAVSFCAAFLPARTAATHDPQAGLRAG